MAESNSIYSIASDEPIGSHLGSGDLGSGAGGGSTVAATSTYTPPPDTAPVSAGAFNVSRIFDVAIGTNCGPGQVWLIMPGETTRGAPRFQPNISTHSGSAYEYVEHWDGHVNGAAVDIYRPYTPDLALRANISAWRFVWDKIMMSPTSPADYGYTPSDPRYLSDSFPLTTIPIGAGQKLHFSGANPEDVYVERTDLTRFRVTLAYAHLLSDHISCDGVVPRCSTTMMAGVQAGSAEVTPVSMVNIVPGLLLTIDYGTVNEETVQVIATTAQTFTAAFAKAHVASTQVSDLTIQGSVNAATVGAVTRYASLDFSAVGNVDAEDKDVIHLSLVLDKPENLRSLRILFDVGDGTFKDCYFFEAIAVTPTLVPAKSGELYASPYTWATLEVKRADFNKTGAAGTPGHDWAKISAFRLEVAANSYGAVIVAFDDLYLSGGAAPDVFAGSPYDYRYTRFDIDTGDESAPSPVVIKDNWVSPRRQPVQVTVTEDPVETYTHNRLYRRGGTLPTGWHMVDELPRTAGPTASYVDELADEYVAELALLEIDNYPPATSTLRTPVNTLLAGAVDVGQQTVELVSIERVSPHQILTIDVGKNQENVVVQAVDGAAGTITAYFQRFHAIGTKVYGDSTYGKPCRYAALAFQRAWLTGDSENPGKLYYSKVGRLSSFPPQNWVDVTSPSDPLLCPIEMGGYLWIPTAATWYRVYAPSGGSQIVSAGGGSMVVQGGSPTPIKTGSKHGLAAPFAWCVIDDDILYLSWDGVYSLRNDEVSKVLQWMFRDEDEIGPLLPIDKTRFEEVTFGYEKNEIFIGYVDTEGMRQRIIYSHRDQRWRNDDVAVTAQLFEEDGARLLIGTADGMIYQDRVGDKDMTTQAGAMQRVTAFADLFERADGALGADYLGFPPDSMPAILNHRTVGRGSAAYLMSLPRGQWCAIEWYGTTGVDYIDLHLRQADRISYWMFSISADGSWYICDNLNYNAVITYGYIAPPQAGDDFRFEADPQTNGLRAYVNDSLITAWLAPTLIPDGGTMDASGYAGFHLSQQAQGDNFRCGTFAQANSLLPEPLLLDLLTDSVDQGKPKHAKVYNEFTIDLNTHGQDVQVAAVFDAGTRRVLLGTVNTAARAQVNLNLNGGKGISSRNVALRLTGAVTDRVDVYEWHIRWLLDAETRQSFSSHWLKYGTDSWKVGKQGWFEYLASAAVHFDCYVDGSETPLFGFDLPACAGRTPLLVKFPAYKFRTLRWVATSTQDFQLYDESHIEVKVIGGLNDWNKAKLMTEG